MISAYTSLVLSIELRYKYDIHYWTKIRDTKYLLHKTFRLTPFSSLSRIFVNFVWFLFDCTTFPSHSESIVKYAKFLPNVVLLFMFTIKWSCMNTLTARPLAWVPLYKPSSSSLSHNTRMLSSLGCSWCSTYSLQKGELVQCPQNQPMIERKDYLNRSNRISKLTKKSNVYV